MIENKKYIKYKKALKEDLEGLMGERLSDEELALFASLFITSIRRKARRQKDYSEQRFEDFLNQGSHIGFTPEAILKMVSVVISHKGDKFFETSSKIKRLRELYDATRLLLVLKKVYGKEYFVESADKKGNDTDFTIVLPEYMFSTKHEKLPRFELMSVVQRDIDKIIDKSLVEGVTELIEDRKFNRDYGPLTSLLIHMNFGSKDFSQRELSERIIKSKSKNPFKSIWVTVWTSEDLKDFAGVQLYPVFQIVHISNEEKLRLLY